MMICSLTLGSWVMSLNTCIGINIYCHYQGQSDQSRVLIYLSHLVCRTNVKNRKSYIFIRIRVSFGERFTQKK